MKTYSLYELNEFLRRVVALNFSESVWLTAEIGQASKSREHWFISLLEKDGDDIIAEMSAVIWASDFKRIKRNLGDDTEGLLTEGIEIRLKGRLDFHERYGLKLIVEDIDPTFTFGKLEIERRRLIEALQNEGLFERNTAVRLPSVVQRIAVISSETAAGLMDFKRHLAENDFAYQFDSQLFTSAMQGVFVEIELPRALEKIAQRRTEFDCVVIVRGGGARLDLSAFDGGAICRAVALFPLPVLVGIGHEVDSTVLDLVAHASLKTPTAVADFLISHNARFENSLLELANFLKFYTQNRLNTEGSSLDRAARSVQFQSQIVLKNQVQKLDNLKQQLTANAPRIFKLEKIKLDNALKIMDLLGIEATLRRGFSISRRADGSPILKKTDVAVGEIIATEVTDGVFKSRVENL